MHNTSRVALLPNILFAFCVLLTDVDTARPAPIPKVPASIPSLSHKICEKWQHAGGVYGYLNIDFKRMDCRFCEGESRDPAQFPGFYFHASGSWKADDCNDLPVPDSPFGLDLGNQAFDDVAALKSLSRFEKQLRWLIIRLKNVTDEVLDVITGFKELECLVLCGPVEDDDLKRLGRMKALKVLRLEVSDITQAGLSHLTTASQLRWLALSLDGDLTEAAAEHLAAMEQLKVLDLLGSGLSPSGFKRLAALDRLESLGVFDRKAAADSITHIASMRRLTSLKVSATLEQVPPGKLRDLSDSRNLQHLDITSYFDVADDDIAALTNCKQLTTLSLNCAEVSSAGLKRLADIRTLRALYLRSRVIDESDLEQLQSLRDLEELNLQAVKMSEKSVESLARMTSLKSLLIDGADVTDDLLGKLTGLKNLQRIDLSRSKVTNAGLKHLETMSSLQWINLNDTSVTSDGVESIRKSLPKCEILSQRIARKK